MSTTKIKELLKEAKQYLEPPDYWPVEAYGKINHAIVLLSEQPYRNNFVLDMPDIDCPKCKRKKSMYWDGRAKVYICPYQKCKHTVRITCADCKIDHPACVGSKKLCSAFTLKQPCQRLEEIEDMPDEDDEGGLAALLEDYAETNDLIPKPVLLLVASKLLPSLNCPYGFTPDKCEVGCESCHKSHSRATNRGPSCQKQEPSPSASPSGEIITSDHPHWKHCATYKGGICDCQPKSQKPEPGEFVKQLRNIVAARTCNIPDRRVISDNMILKAADRIEQLESTLKTKQTYVDIWKKAHTISERKNTEQAGQIEQLQAENEQQVDFLSLAKEEMDSLQADNADLTLKVEYVLKYANSVSYNDEEKIKAINQALKEEDNG